MSDDGSEAEGRPTGVVGGDVTAGLVVPEGRTGGVPEAVPAPGPSRRRLWRRAEPVEQATTGTQVVDIHIEPSDPVLAFLQSAPGPVEVGALPPSSAAVIDLKASGVEIVVPLVSSGELVGLVALGARLSERGYSRDDRRLLESLARYAAPALRLGQLVREQEEEARSLQRLESELQVAQLIQQQFLPHQLPDLGGWHVAAFYRPARTVGGDFYDIVDLGDGRVMVVTGDVTDKGVPAALVMASTHALLRSLAHYGPPGKVLARVNELLVPQIPQHMFVTCLVMVVDLKSGQTQFANAGHNLPYLRRNGSVTQLRARGMPLGLIDGSVYEEHEVVIEPGDLLLLYSDGITEQHDADGDMFGFERTERLVHDGGDGEMLVDRCVAALSAFSGALEQEDDVTLVALERRTRPASGQRVSFTVDSVPGNEREVMRRVIEVAAAHLQGRRLDALGTAASETAMNAIEHGNEEQPEKAVEVEVTVDDRELTVSVTDHGGGRLGAEPEVPDIDLKLAGLQSPRGWGLFLVERMVDRVHETTDEQRHTVHLVMNLVTDDESPRGEDGEVPR